MYKTVQSTFLLEAFSALSLSVSRRDNTGCQISNNYSTRELFLFPFVDDQVNQSSVEYSLERNVANLYIA